MLTPDLPKAQTALTVVPQKVQVVLAEDDGHPLALVLPPFEDLFEIEALKESQISLAEITLLHEGHVEKAFMEELEHEKRKLERFAESPKFLNRLAVLAAAGGDRDQEAHYLELARRFSDDAFFRHRIGDNLIARDRDSDAERVFESLDLESDASANLKLAVFHIRRRDFSAAEARVRKALEIDPLDFGARLFDGGLKLARQDYSGALHSFRVAAEERPTSAALHANMGVAYVGLNLREKALSALKRATALDPINANTVCLLADLANRSGTDEEAIPSLRYLLQFEQKRWDVWSRLARACLRIGIRLASSEEVKTRIRQKLNLELARHWSGTNPGKARRLLERVIDAREGEAALIRQARAELARLPNKA